MFISFLVTEMPPTRTDLAAREKKTSYCQITLYANLRELWIPWLREDLRNYLHMPWPAVIELNKLTYLTREHLRNFWAWCVIYTPSLPPPLPLQTTPNKQTCVVKQQYLLKIFLCLNIFLKRSINFFFFATKIEHAGFGSLINRLINCLRLGK